LKKAAATGASLDSELKKISSGEESKRSDKFKALIAPLVAKKDLDGMTRLVNHVVKEEGVKQGLTRDASEVVIALVAEVGRLDGPMKEDNKEVQVLMEGINAILQPKAEEFGYAYMKSLQLLSLSLQAQAEYKRAAHSLQIFKFQETSPTLVVTPSEKVDWYVNTAELWLEIDEIANASGAVKKAHPIVAEIKSDPKLLFRFKTCQARVFDNERKFLDAALKYLELAQTGTELKYSEGDLLQTLENAVTCAILSPPSSNRARVLGMLMSDHRSTLLRNYNMLEKMFKERIVRQTEVEAFQKLLQQHQNAETSTGRTVLANSVIEHNIFAASKIYNNITFPELAVLLGIQATEAETLACRLIEEGRMKATIDQVDGVVEFESATDSLHVWDDQITQLCGVVNDVLENIVKKNPQYKALM